MHPQKYTIWTTQYIKRYWYLIVLLVFLSFGAVLIELLLPFPLKFLADNVFGDAPVPDFLPDSKPVLLTLAAGTYVTINALQTVYSAFQEYITRLCSQRVDISSLMDAYDAAINTPYNHTRRKANGTYLYQITSQSQQMSEFILTNIVFIFQSVLTLIGVAVVLIALNATAVLIAFTTLPILALFVIRYGKVLEKKSSDTEMAHSKVFAFIDESLAKLRTIQSFVLHNTRVATLLELLRIRNRFALKQLTTNQRYSIGIELIILISIAATILVGGTSVLSGALTFGALLVIITYTDNVFAQVSNIVETVGSMKIQAASLQQAYDIVTTAPKPDAQLHAPLPAVQGRIEFDNVTLSRGNRTVVENVDLVIEPGTAVAIVGPSGSGKTTILNSLLKFVPPAHGWIKIDNTDIMTCSTDDIRKNVSLIEQEPDLFDVTIGENIRLADPDKPYALLDIMSAASLSGSKEFIEVLPDQYDTPVGNTTLSGGQKQRLAIARAIYKRSPIILMDEPTSALDDRSAHTFINNMLTYFNGQTLVIVTHELSLLRKIPTIYVVKDKTVKPIADYGGLEAYARQLVDIS